MILRWYWLCFAYRWFELTAYVGYLACTGVVCLLGWRFACSRKDDSGFCSRWVSVLLSVSLAIETAVRVMLGGYVVLDFADEYVSVAEQENSHAF